MTDSWETMLARWAEAGLVSDEAVTRIKTWEDINSASPGSRWPARLALALGGIMVSAGILLFVAAHWDALSPLQRFALVLLTVGAFHVAASLCAGRSEALAATLHACGTVALGGGIFLAGQIFNLPEHWPRALLVWAAGAGAGWALLRQWPQALLAALITPAWLVGEWTVAGGHRQGGGAAAAGILLLALAYLGAEPGSRAAAPVRRALVWIGGIATIPSAFFFLAFLHESGRHARDVAPSMRVIGWSVAVGLPLAVAWILRGRAAIAIVAAALWVAAGTWLANAGGVLPYLWSAALAAGLVSWGVMEHRRERINLGVAGFALTVLVFYFSSVMDRLGRSASLIGLGLLFLGGGYVLEQTRRRLLARVGDTAR